jgi:hypothetical protein
MSTWEMQGHSPAALAGISAQEGPQQQDQSLQVVFDHTSFDASKMYEVLQVRGCMTTQVLLSDFLVHVESSSDITSSGFRLNGSMLCFGRLPRNPYAGQLP